MKDKRANNKPGQSNTANTSGTTVTPSSSTHANRQSARTASINPSSPSKTGGGILSSLALLIGLGACGGSAYLYTELQKYKGLNADLNEKNKTAVKAEIGGINTEIQNIQSSVLGVTDNVGNVSNSLGDVNTELGSFKEQLSSYQSSVDTYKSDLESVSGKLNQLGNDLELKITQLGSALTSSSEQLQKNSDSAIMEVAQSTALAVQELTSNTQNELTSLSQQFNTQQNDIQLTTEKQFNNVDNAMKQLDTTLQTTYELAHRGQSEWILAEVEYLLRTGAHRVALAGDVKAATIAFRAASKRLHELDNQNYIPVRGKIADEISEMRQVGVPDIEGLVFEIEQLSERADTLPLPPSDMERALAAAKKDPSKFDGVTEQFLRTMQNLVKIEKADGTPVSKLGKPSKKQLDSSEGLRLNLQAARLSALRRDPETYLLHMDAAEKYVQKFYDNEAELTKGYIADLGDLRAVNIVPVVKSLGNALNLFNQIHSQRDEK